MKKAFVIEVIGWIGTIALLLAYGLLSGGYLDASYAYQSMNILGAVGLCIVALYKRTWQVVVVEIFWISIGVYGLSKLMNLL